MKKYACLLLAALAIICVCACTRGGQAGADTTANATGQAGEEALILSLQEAGFSEGSLEKMGTIENVFGETLQKYKDDRYEYTVSEDGSEIVSGLMHGELRDAADAGQVLPESEMERLAAEHAKMLYGYYAWEANEVEFITEFVSDGFPAGHIEVTERAQGCLVNSNLFSMARDGSVISFTRMHNSLEDFANTDELNTDEVKQIVLGEVLAMKDSPVINEPTYFPYIEEDGSYPSISLLVEDMEDLTFLLVEKQMPDHRTPRWVAEVLTQTSWDVDYVWRIEMDIKTGEVVINEKREEYLPEDSPRNA
ncbi:hypothetical protein LJC56_03230 [Christensenellaceae bacterium OttesenSCG-928-K19]|nr:hypothetical protein [Christensenellaceae bacterium OttesenSCG-928-K19]